MELALAAVLALAKVKAQARCAAGQKVYERALFAGQEPLGALLHIRSSEAAHHVGHFPARAWGALGGVGLGGVGLGGVGLGGKRSKGLTTCPKCVERTCR